MTRKRLTAIERLDAAVKRGMGLESDGTLPLYLEPEWRRYRRALNALLRERGIGSARAAEESAGETCGATSSHQAIIGHAALAAVLGRKP